MKINNLGYLFKEGIRGIFLHGFMSFAAVCVTVACLLIVGSFFSLMYNVNIMVEDLNKTSEIRAFVDSSLSDAEAKSIGTKINRIPNVLSATFVDREQALEDFVADFQEEGNTFIGVDPDTLDHRFVVILEDNSLMRQTVEQIKAIEGVTDIRAEYEMAEGFSTIQSVLNFATWAITAVLLLVSLLIISNTVKLAMYDRRDEIAIMKIVGATNGFIRMPFVVEGFTLGMIGAAIAFFVEWLLYDTAVMRLEAVDSWQLFNFVPFTDLLAPMILTFVSAGLFVGVVGSLTSIRKFMDV